MPHVDDIIEKFQRLNLEQKHLVEQLIDEISHNPDTLQHTPVTTRHTSEERRGNSSFISANGIALAPGDKVRIITSRKTGKSGDIATITKFNKKFVAVKLDRNGSDTQRASKYLEFIQLEQAHHQPAPDP